MLKDQHEHEQEWLEHWFTVGRISKDAESELREVHAEIVKMGNSPIGLIAVGLSYSDPIDETGFTVSQKGELLHIDVYNPDNYIELVIYSVEGETDIIQASVKDTRLITINEWYKLCDERGNNEDIPHAPAPGLTPVVNMVYIALLETFNRVKEPGKNALVIPLVSYAQELGTDTDTLRNAIISLKSEHRIYTRKLNYPLTYPESWEITFAVTPGQGIPELTNGEAFKPYLKEEL